MVVFSHGCLKIFRPFREVPSFFIFGTENPNCYVYRAQDENFESLNPAQVYKYGSFDLFKSMLLVKSVLQPFLYEKKTWITWKRNHGINMEISFCFPQIAKLLSEFGEIICRLFSSWRAFV